MNLRNTKKQRKLNLLSVLLLIVTLYESHAQCFYWDWAESAGGWLVEVGNAIAVDGQKSIVTGGFYSSGINFGNGVSLPSPDIVDGFIVKYDYNGTTQWAIEVQGNGEDKVTSVAIDTWGNIFATGYFNSNTLKFDISSHTVNNINGFDAFIVKLDSNGTPLWYYSVGGTDDDGGSCVVTDSLGNVYFVGWFRDNSISFQGYVLNNVNTNYSADIFIFKLDANGNVLWAKALGSSGDDKAGNKQLGCAIDPLGNLIVTGTFSGDSLCYGGSSCLVNTFAGNKDIFVVKYDTGGNPLWGRSFGSTASDRSNDVAADQNGNILITGYIKSTVLFDSFEVSSSGGNDAFLLSLDKQGNVKWVQLFGGTGNEEGIAVSSKGKYIAIAGMFTSNPLIIDTFSLHKNGGNEIFTILLDTSGNLLWAKRVGKSDDDFVYECDVNDKGDVVITGSFISSSLSFRNYYLPDITVDNSKIFLYDSDDYYVARIKNMSFTINPITNNVRCFGLSDGSINLNPTPTFISYTVSWNTGDTTLSIDSLGPGLYKMTITSVKGCSYHDSFIITQPPPITVDSFTINDVLCFGDSTGAIAVFASGGTPPLMGLWSTLDSGFTLIDIPSGTYMLTILDSAGCAKYDTFIVVQPLPLSINATISSAPCNEDIGSIQVTAQGGTPPYYYLWSTGDTTPNLSGLTYGSYILTVIDDNGCSFDTILYVPGSDTPLLQVSIQNVLCHGDSTGNINLTVVSPNGIASVMWSTGDTSLDLYNLPAGNYNVTVIDTIGCTSSYSVSILEPPPLIDTMFSMDDTNYNANGSAWVVVNGGTPPYYYFWNTGATTDSIFNLISGIYTVKITDNNGCTIWDSVYVGVILDVSIHSSKLSCTMRKKRNYHIIQCTEPMTKLMLINSDSRVIFQTQPNTNYFAMPIHKPKSPYILIITTLSSKQFVYYFTDN